MAAVVSKDAQNPQIVEPEGLYEVIDGRKKLAAHQRLLNMPLWGIYMQPQGVPEDVAEAKAKSRITALVHYLQVIQEK